MIVSHIDYWVGVEDHQDSGGVVSGCEGCSHADNGHVLDVVYGVRDRARANMPSEPCNMQQQRALLSDPKSGRDDLIILAVKTEMHLDADLQRAADFILMAFGLWRG